MTKVRHFDKLLRIGRKISFLRKEQGLTQQALAEKANIHRVTLSEIENGFPTSVITLIDILCALGQMNLLDGLLGPKASTHDSVFKGAAVEVVNSVDKLKGNRLNERSTVQFSITSK